MRRPLLAAALLALLVPTLPLAAAARGPSTPEERKRALQITRKLEEQPLARRTLEERKWLFQWIVDIPDINVKSCSGPLDPLMNDEERYGKLLWIQQVFGMVAFLIENPKKANDWATVQAAGIESVLRAYRSVLKVDSDARWKELDALEKVQKAGKLKKLVLEKMAECPKESPEGEFGPLPEDAI